MFDDSTYDTRYNFRRNHPDCPEGYKFWSNFRGRFEIVEAMNRKGLTKADVVMSGNAYDMQDNLMSNGMIAAFVKTGVTLYE